MRIIYVMLTLCLLLYALLGLWARPVADDFCEMLTAREYPGLNMAAHTYETWSGRYMLFAVMGVSFNVAGPDVAALTPMILISAFVLTWIWALRPLTIHAPLIVLTLAVAIIGSMPNIFQGLYWSSSSLNYLAPLVVSGGLVGALVRNWHPMFIAALTFVSAGFNEPHALVQILLLAAALLRWRRVSVVTALVSTGIGLVVSFLAPGNAIRAALQPFPQPLLTSAWIALQATAIRGLESVANTPLTLALPFVTGWLLAPDHHDRRMLLKLLAILVGGLALATLTVFPVQYATGAPEARAYTLAQAIFAVTAFALGRTVGSGHRLQSHTLTLIVGLALISTLAWTLGRAPDLLRYAVQVDHGQLSDYLADQIRVARDSAPWVADCRQQLAASEVS